MSSNTPRGQIVRVTEKGQATIPKALRDRFGIATPGRVFIFEEGGKIVVEPIPTVEEMRGVHADRYERGAVLEYLRDMDAEDKRLEREEDPDLRRNS